MNTPADSFEEEAVTLIWTLSLVVGFSVADVSFTNAKHSLQQEKPAVTVLVRDLVGIDPPIRSLARAQAIRILNDAGIELRWIDANGSEGLQLPSTTKSYLTVVILAQPPNGWTRRGTMGFAPIRTGPYPRAYVMRGELHAK